MIDKIDQAILRELQKNARITMNKLSEQVGLSKSPCHQRVKRLQDKGYILGYTTLIDQSKMGLNHIAFVQVNLKDTSNRALNDFNQHIRNIPEIEQCHLIAGGFDYLLKVRTRDMAEFRALLGNQMSDLPHVQQTTTFVAMESVKDPESGLVGS